MAYYTRRHTGYTAIQTITTFFEQYAERLPLELFVLVGSFIEELISPIPSIVVLTPAGAAAQAQDVGVLYVAFLAVLSAVGRLGGAVILYWLAHRAEGALLRRKRRFLGVTHQDVQALHSRLNKGKYGPWIALFLMHAVPVFPAAALSLACGFIKLRFSTFITSTLFGTMVSALFFLFIGYAGLQATDAAQHLEYASQAALVLLVLGIGLWVWWHSKQKNHS